MKKLLALAMVMLLLCSQLTACGGSSEPSAASSVASSAAPSTASSTAPDAVEDEEEEEDDVEVEADSDDITAEYEAIMSEFIGNFEDLMTSLDELLAMSEDIATEEDLIAWCEAFDEIKEITGTSADELASVAEYVPEEYAESHAAITVAVAAVYDGMTGFEDAVVGAISGDADAFETGLIEFVANMIAADELWQSAVE